MDGEMFQVIFNSQGANVVSNANLNSVIYNVNWGAFLPRKYKKFHCQFVFKSLNYAGILTDNGFVNMNLGTINSFDGYGMSSNLGIIYPIAQTASTSFYNSTNNDNNDFSINYPTNLQIQIKLNTFAGVAISNMPHYCLLLNLRGITDTELGTI